MFFLMQQMTVSKAAMVAVAAEEIPEEAVMVKILVGILGTAATGMKMVGSAALVVVVMVVAMMKETIVAAKAIDHTPGMANYKRGMLSLLLAWTLSYTAWALLSQSWSSRDCRVNGSYICERGIADLLIYTTAFKQQCQ
jgi:hypothetical protein